MYYHSCTVSFLEVFDYPFHRDMVGGDAVQGDRASRAAMPRRGRAPHGLVQGSSPHGISPTRFAAWHPVQSISQLHAASDITNKGTDDRMGVSHLDLTKRPLKTRGEASPHGMLPARQGLNKTEA